MFRLENLSISPSELSGVDVFDGTDLEGGVIKTSSTAKKNTSKNLTINMKTLIENAKILYYQ
jgi:hypothetical protein